MACRIRRSLAQLCSQQMHVHTDLAPLRVAAASAMQNKKKINKQRTQRNGKNMFQMITSIMITVIKTDVG